MIKRRKKAIDIEAKRMHEAVLHSAQGQFEQAKIWNKRSLLLGIPASAIAAIGGVAGLTNVIGKELVAVASIIAAALTAIVTTMNYSKRIDQAHSNANAYLALQQDIRIFIDIDLPGLKEGDAREQLSKLVARQQEINGAALIPSKKAYKRAKAIIEAGGQSYKIDEEVSHED